MYFSNCDIEWYPNESFSDVFYCVFRALAFISIDPYDVRNGISLLALERPNQPISLLHHPLSCKGVTIGIYQLEDKSSVKSEIISLINSLNVANEVVAEGAA